MSGLVLSCEHARWGLPPDVDLGVPQDVLQSQASWDHGALDIAMRWSDALGIHCHAGAFSRMYVDLNRAADHEGVVPRISYGAMVPGNAAICATERAQRIAMFHQPYWAAVRTDVLARLTEGNVFHLSSHSFSPELDPASRTFDVGVLYDPAHDYEAQIAERMLFVLRGAGFDVRANQPYGGVGAAICTSFRRELGARYAGIQLETSHAVTMTPDGCARVANALLPFLEAL